MSFATTRTTGSGLTSARGVRGVANLRAVGASHHLLDKRCHHGPCRSRDRASRRRLQALMSDAPLPLAIICDLDGTLALLNGRSPYDASMCLDDGLNVPIAHIVRTY